MAIKYFKEGTGYRLPAKAKTTAWLVSCVHGEGYRIGQVNYVFCSSQRHSEMNRHYLGHDYFTDVITFDYSDLAHSKTIAGDIFIDPETVADNAAGLGTDPEEEMRRVLVHGLLHLCGYGDKTQEEEKRMRAKEDFYLSLFADL